MKKQYGIWMAGLLMTAAIPVQARKIPVEESRIKKTVLEEVRMPQKKGNGRAKAAKDRTWGDNMYGGWSRYDVYGDFTDIFGFDIEDPTSLYELSTAPELVENNHQICAAAWDGKQIQFVSEIYYPSYERYVIGYRGTLDPLTGQMRLLGNTGYASQETGNLSSLAYDKTSGKLFGLNLDGLLYEVSMQDSTSALVDTVRWQGQRVSGYLLTLSASPGGSLFSISSGGYLYKIDKRTAEATLVGPVGGEAVQAAYQSAVFDQISGVLYWARVVSDGIDLCTVDTLSGEASFYSDFGIQTVGLFHQYYENAEDVQPSAVSDLAVDAEGMRVRLSWINPSSNVLDMPLESIAEARVYRAEGLGEYSLMATVDDAGPGMPSSCQYVESDQGYYRYGVTVVNGHGLESPMMEADYGLYTYELPYATGFEASDDASPLVPDSTVAFVTDPDLVYEGERSAFIPQFSRLRFAGMPFEKGSTYRISFTARGYEAGMESEGTPFLRRPFATLNVRFNSDQVYYPEASRSLDWADAAVDFYVAETGRYTWAFTTSVFDVYYVDNVRVELLIPNTTPGKVQDACAENEGTSLDAVLHWRNPVLTAGGDPLEDLQDVIVQVAQYNSFDPDEIVLADTVPATEPGGLMEHSMKMPHDGFWNFRFVARNTVGESPMDTVVRSAWIGRDTVMDYPEGIEAFHAGDGTIRLTWNRLPETGAHGGDLDGTVTGYRVIRMDGNGESVSETVVPDTVYVSEPLPMNFYTFSINGIRNGMYEGDSNSVRLVGGLRGGQRVVEDIAYDAGFSDAPFHVSTEFSDQSTVNQIIYPRSAFQEPCFIDTLYFFMEPPALSVSQRIKVHLGTYPKDGFGYYNLEDWVAIDSLSEGFAGNIRFERGQAVLKVPVEPFFYDGEENLLLSVIKGQQTARMDVLFVNNSFYEGYRQIHDYHTSIMSDYYDLTGKPVMASPMQIAPILAVNGMEGLNTLQGRIIAVNGDPLGDALVAVSSREGSGMAFSRDIRTDTAGRFSFSYFPDNTYQVRVSKEGFQDVDTVLVLGGGEVRTWDITMEASAKVCLTGTVRGRQSEAVAGARVSIAGIDSVQAWTDEAGNFQLDSVYGATRYTLCVDHDLYMPYRSEVSVGMEPLNLVDTVFLTYYPFPVRSPQADLTEDGVVVSWQEPLASRGSTERKYYNEEDGAICSSSELSVGIRFTRQQLRESYADGQMLTGLAFHANDTTAFFSAEIYSGDMENPVQVQGIGYLAEGMQRIFLDEPLAVDTTKDLIVALHAESGYAGCPFSKDKGPQLDNGSLINQGDGWRQMSDYMVDGEGYNWIISAFFGSVQEVDAPDGYRVYRALKENSLGGWEELGRTDAGTFSFVDADWDNLSYGDYLYAVRSDWFDGNLGDYRISSVLSKDMFFEVTVQVQDPMNVLTWPMRVDMYDAEGGDEAYYQEVAEGMVAVFDSVRRGDYGLRVQGSRYEGRISRVAVASDTTVYVMVEPVGAEPLLEASLNVQPNPSVDGYFWLDAEGWEGADLKVFALDGRVVLAKEVKSRETELNLSNCPSGIYLLRLSNGQRVSHLKLVIR